MNSEPDFLTAQAGFNHVFSGGSASLACRRVSAGLPMDKSGPFVTASLYIDFCSYLPCKHGPALLAKANLAARST